MQTRQLFPAAEQKLKRSFGVPTSSMALEALFCGAINFWLVFLKKSVSRKLYNNGSKQNNVLGVELREAKARNVA